MWDKPGASAILSEVTNYGLIYIEVMTPQTTEELLQRELREEILEEFNRVANDWLGVDRGEVIDKILLDIIFKTIQHLSTNRLIPYEFLIADLYLIGATLSLELEIYTWS